MKKRKMSIGTTARTPAVIEQGIASDAPRTVIITGATGRIGVEIVKQVVAHFLSAKTAAHVVAVARSEKKGQALLDQTLAAFPTVVAVAAGAGAVGLAAARAPSPRGSGAHTTSSSSAIKLKAKNNLKSNDGQVSVSLELLDVSLQSSVKAFAARWGRERPLHVLINNAAVTPGEQQFTAEKIDLQWATNVLGYHWMMREFGPMLMLGGGAGARKGSSSSTSSPARVVNVASFYAGGLDLGDPEFAKTRAYDVDESYRASKMANRMQSRGFAEKWKADNIVVNAVHPGVATSSVSLGLGFDLDRSQAAAEKCARGPVYWAVKTDTCLEDEINQNHRHLTGRYFEGENVKPKKCAWQEDAAGVETLMTLCESYKG